MRSVWAARVALKAAWAVLRQNLLRSVLTLATCGMGTAGVIVAGVLGRANVAEMQSRIRSLGGNLVVVSPNKRPPYPGQPRQIDHYVSLEPEDGDALASQVPCLQAVVPVAARNTTAGRENHTARVRLIGTTPAYLRVRDFSMDRGRFFRPEEDRQAVIVLGHAVAQELAPQGSPVGDSVLLGGHPYEVVGALRPQGVNFAGEDEDHQVFIPLDTYRRRISNRPWLAHLYLQLGPEADPARTVQRVQALLRQRHGRMGDQADDVVVRDLADLASQQQGLLATATWAVRGTSGLLLGLGAVGIAALMLLVVRQRRGEIGLRRALGATPRDIALQFLAEGLTLSVVGVCAGLGLGLLASLVVARTAAEATLDVGLVGMGVLVSLGASSLACLVPALAAARMSPAEALRA